MELGEKKWITNGVFADYFTVAVRTGEGTGMNGLSLLVLERGAPTPPNLLDPRTQILVLHTIFGQKPCQMSRF